MTRLMKDSGIEWIGEIPANWGVFRAKYLFQTGDGALKIGPFGSALSGKALAEGPYKIYNQAHLVSNDFSLCRHFVSEETYRDLQSYEVAPGDILFSMMGTIGKCRVMPAGQQQGIMDSHLLKARLNDLIIPRFFEYVYDKDLSPIGIGQLSYFSNGSIMAGLNSSIVKNVFFPLPSVTEQHRIADFLDRRCAEIDAVIERTKATIEEYKKLKQAVITEAVTKGVRGARKMKDSGIEWLGCIPDEWDCTKLKQVWISVDSGVSVNAADYPTENDTQYGVLKTSCVSKFVFLPHEHKQVDADEYDRVACPVKKDTIIVSRMNTPDLVGACGYVDADYPNLFLPDRLWQIGFHPEVIAKFVWYYLNNQMVRAYISSLSTGTSSSMQNISKPQFGGISLVVPAIEEQHEIVAYLDEKCAALDTLIAKKTALLTELETYKKSLIYEYVTGKKEVL